MTQVLERPNQSPLEPVTSAVQFGQIERDDMLNQLNEKAEPNPSTKLFRGTEGPISVLPRAIDDVYSQHDLVAEGQTLANSTDVLDGEVRPSPPMTTVSDGLIAARALQNIHNVDRLVSEYGQDSYTSALKKAEAVVDVSAAAIFPGKIGFSQYERLRKGLPQDPSLPQLRLKAPKGSEPSDLNAFVEEPIRKVPSEPLTFNVEETRVVLAALRLTHLYPMAKGDDLAAMDLMTRYTPSHSERAFYRALLERSGVQLEVAPSQSPDYQQPNK